MPLGRPNRSGIASISSAIVKFRMALKRIAGLIRGMVTFQSVRIGPAPEIRAASSSEGSAAVVAERQ